MEERTTHPVLNTGSGNTFPSILRKNPLSRQVSQCLQSKASAVLVISSLRGSYALYRNAESLIRIPSMFQEQSQYSFIPDGCLYLEISWIRSKMERFDFELLNGLPFYILTMRSSILPIVPRACFVAISFYVSVYFSFNALRVTDCIYSGSTTHIYRPFFRHQ